MSALYVLSTELVPVHEGGVQAAAALSDDVLVTGGDDNMVAVWRRVAGSKDFESLHVCSEHGGNLRAISPIAPNAAFPNGGFVTACLDKMVRLYAISAAGVVTLERTLAGHTGGVISLSWTPDGLLISGSWDGTARVWEPASGACTAVLSGHENGVCVLGLPTGDIATGSTGRKDEADRHVDFKVRLWRRGSAGWTLGTSLTDHTQAVRDLALLPPAAAAATGGWSGFVSVGNDGALVVRGTSGAPSVRFVNPPTEEGNPAFAFRVAALPQPQQPYQQLVATSNEDGVVRVYDVAPGAPRGLIDEIRLPGTPWAVAGLPCGDILIACNQAGASRRGHAYVWTRDHAARGADDATRARFAVDLQPPARAADASSAAASGAGLRVTAAYDERDAHPAERDGVFGYFSLPDGGVMVCTWSAGAQAWQDIGRVTDGPSDGSDPGEAATGIDMANAGPVYDIDTRVSVETPANGVRSLPLRFNEDDDANTVARAFITTHGIDEDNWEAVRNHVLELQTTRRNSRSAEAAKLPQFRLFPMRAYVVHDEANWSKVLPKLLETSSGAAVGGSQDAAVAALALTPGAEVRAIEGLVDVLADTSHWHALEVPRPAVALLLRKTLRWPGGASFPAVDVLRMLVCHPDGAAALAEVGGAAAVGNEAARITALRDEPAARNAVLLSARMLFNCFKEPPTRNLVLLPTIADHVLDAASSCLNHADSAVRFAGTVIVVNYAHACACGWRAGRGAAAPLAVTAGVGPVTPVIPRLLLGLIVDGLRVVKEPAGVINLLAALGTLVLIGYGPDATAVAIGESLATLLEGSPPESIRSVVADVRAAFVTAHK